MLFRAERRVLVSATEPLTRWRFPIAHELGHCACQCVEGRTDPIYCRAEDVGVDQEAKALEREANVFAAELLMPEPAVRAEFEQATSAAELAGWCGVSEEAMSWRLYNFGLTHDAPVPSKG